VEQSDMADHRKGDEAAGQKGGEDLHGHDALSLFFVPIASCPRWLLSC
jgi:hypothetical protein